MPGAAVAVLADGELVEAAHGVLSRSTGVAATTDSVFPICSVTKVWTATLVMQLVDDGRVDLDAPVRRYLPDFRVADEQASARITVRHLLCHTAGFEGDIFTDTGRGDDAIETCVRTFTGVPQLFPPGELFSYANSGYVVLGRLVEVLRDKPYAAALRDHLFAPLGLRHATTDPSGAIGHRVAAGHVTRDPRVGPEPVPAWLLASNAPAGSMLAMSAADLLHFVRAHLAGGLAAAGQRLLAPETADQMRQRYMAHPYRGGVACTQGLGWQLYDWDGGTVVGHDGDVPGFAAYLRVAPAAGVAVALLTNGGSSLPVYRSIVGRVLEELAGVRMPPTAVPPPAPGPVADPHRYTGRYETRLVCYDVTDDEGRLWMSVTPLGMAAQAGMPAERYEIVRLDGDAFVSAEPAGGPHTTVTFVGTDAGGLARFLHQGRAVPRVAD